MKQLKIYIILGIFFSITAGIIFHFVYEWTSNNFFAGLFFPINESVWEHMKLVYFPMLLYSFIMKRKFVSVFPCISSALAGGILTGTLFVPVFFFTYTGILGYDIPVMDIITFVLSIVIAFYVIYKFTLSCGLEKYSAVLYLLTGIFLICFILFSINPPSIGLFQNLEKMGAYLHIPFSFFNFL